MDDRFRDAVSLRRLATVGLRGRGDCPRDEVADCVESRLDVDASIMEASLASLGVWIPNEEVEGDEVAGEALTTEPKARCKGRGPALAEDDATFMDWRFDLEFDSGEEGSIPLDDCGMLLRNEDGGGGEVFAFISLVFYKIFVRPDVEMNSTRFPVQSALKKRVSLSVVDVSPLSLA